MAYQTPRTWAASERPTAAQFNQDIRDNVSFLANPPACRVYRTAVESLNSNAFEILTMQAERYDTNSMWSAGSPTRITINTAGLYLCTFDAALAARNDYEVCYVGIRVDGSTYIGLSASKAAIVGSADCHLNVASVYKFTAGQYIEAAVMQRNTAAAAANVAATAAYSPEFSATWIGLG